MTSALIWGWTYYRWDPVQWVLVVDQVLKLAEQLGNSHCCTILDTDALSQQTLAIYDEHCTRTPLHKLESNQQIALIADERQPSSVLRLASACLLWSYLRSEGNTRPHDLTTSSFRTA